MENQFKKALKVTKEVLEFRVGFKMSPLAYEKLDEKVELTDKEKGEYGVLATSKLDVER